MTYATKQNLIDCFSEVELIQLTDFDNLGVINDTVLTKALTDADAEINGYLTAYPLPLTTVPANLVRIACDIARYYLYRDQVIEGVEKRYANAVKYLQMIGKGQIRIGPDVNGDISATKDSGIDFFSSRKIFGDVDF